MKMGMASLLTGIFALGLAMTRDMRGDQNERFVYHPLRYIH